MSMLINISGGSIFSDFFIHAIKKHVDHYLSSYILMLDIMSMSINILGGGIDYEEDELAVQLDEPSHPGRE